ERENKHVANLHQGEKVKARSSVILALFTAALAQADGPADNLVDNVRPVPPPGIAIPADARGELQSGIDSLGEEIDALRQELKAKPALLELLPDVQIYHNAVRYALTYHEFFDLKEIS